MRRHLCVLLLTSVLLRPASAGVCDSNPSDENLWANSNGQFNFYFALAECSTSVCVDQGDMHVNGTWIPSVYPECMALCMQDTYSFTSYTLQYSEPCADLMADYADCVTRSSDELGQDQIDACRQSIVLCASNTQATRTCLPIFTNRSGFVPSLPSADGGDSGVISSSGMYGLLVGSTAFSAVLAVGWRYFVARKEELRVRLREQALSSTASPALAGVMIGNEFRPADAHGDFGGSPTDLTELTGGSSGHVELARPIARPVDNLQALSVVVVAQLVVSDDEAMDDAMDAQPSARPPRTDFV